MIQVYLLSYLDIYLTFCINLRSYLLAFLSHGLAFFCSLNLIYFSCPCRFDKGKIFYQKEFDVSILKLLLLKFMFKILIMINSFGKSTSVCIELVFLWFYKVFSCKFFFRLRRHGQQRF